METNAPMSPEALEARLRTARRLVTEAGAMALRLRPPPGAPVATLKGAQDWLTEADGAVEAMLARGLAEAHPQDGFQGEETGRGREGGCRWVVDPIDGTSNFARGADRWCVSVGLIAGRQPLLGVVFAPAQQELFAARLGGGATRNGTAITAASTTDLTRAMIEVGWSARVTAASYIAMTGRVMATGATTRSSGSGAMGLADVACGRIDGYMETHINLWDVAGMLPILIEAGARIGPFMDGDGPTHGGPILAAAAGVFDSLERAM